MKTTKRFQTTGIKNYRLSNATYQVSFDTFEEAVKFVENEREKHPRSKKFNPFIRDNEKKVSTHYIDAIRIIQNSK